MTWYFTSPGWRGIGGFIVILRPVIKYPLVVIDAKINLKGDLDYACEVAANTTGSLVQTIPSFGGQPQITYGRIGLLLSGMCDTGFGKLKRS